MSPKKAKTESNQAQAQVQTPKQTEAAPVINRINREDEHDPRLNPPSHKFTTPPGGVALLGKTTTHSQQQNEQPPFSPPSQKLLNTTPVTPPGSARNSSNPFDKETVPQHQVPQPAPPIPQSTTNRQLFIGDTNTAASVASKSKKGHDHTHHVSFFESCFSGLKAFVKLKINALIKKHVAHANSLRDDHISFEGGEGEPDQTKRKITIKVKAPASVFTNNFKQALQEFGKTLIDDFCKYKKIPTNQADHYEITVIPEVFEVTELNLNDLKAKIINALQQEADRLLGVHDCFPAYSLFRNDEVAVPKAAALTQLITQVNNKNNINEVIDVMIKVADRSCDIFAQERSDNYSYALLDKRQHEYWDAMVGCMGEKNSTTYDNLLSVFKTVQQFQDHYAKHQLTV